MIPRVRRTDQSIVILTAAESTTRIRTKKAEGSVLMNSSRCAKKKIYQFTISVPYFAIASNDIDETQHNHPKGVVISKDNTIYIDLMKDKLNKTIATSIATTQNTPTPCITFVLTSSVVQIEISSLRSFQSVSCS